ncbi:MAG: threonine/serine dehydratase [Firmicutes bacterium]|nr:threonine/serine dehydratase [Bacillota bacterium]
MIGLKDIEAASLRIAPYIIHTPIVRLPGLDKYLGCRVYAKAECLQLTGAFKIRGALNKMLQMSKEDLAGGVVAASSGNHGKALSLSARMLGAKACIVIPDTAPDIKVNAIKALGADVVRSTTAERFKVAEGIARERGAVVVHPYNDEDIMAGQGTLGLEIARDMPDLDKVVVPVSGGGLIGGVSTAVKELCPGIKVIGAEPAALPRYTASLAAGRPVAVEQKPTLADALVSNRPGDLCFPQVAEYVDEIADVSDEEMLRGSKLLLLEGHLLAEFSSAIGIGGVLAGKIKVSPEEKVCFVISGGSVDLPQLDRLKSVSI